MTDLYIAGLGIGGPKRMTCEVRELLISASRVLHLSAIDADLRAMCKGEVINLLDAYMESDEPDVVYPSIASLVVSAAAEASAESSYAVYATYGHPLLIEDSSREAIQLCNDRGLSYGIVPGLSCIDTLMIDSPVSLDSGGQYLDCRQFVAYSITIDPRVPLVLLEAGDFGSDDQLRPDPQDTARFAPLEARLAEIYPPEHSVHIVFSAYKTGVRSRIRHTSVGELANSWPLVHTGATMVLPGVRMRDRSPGSSGR